MLINACNYYLKSRKLGYYSLFHALSRNYEECPERCWSASKNIPNAAAESILCRHLDISGHEECYDGDHWGNNAMRDTRTMD